MRTFARPPSEYESYRYGRDGTDVHKSIREIYYFYCLLLLQRQQYGHSARLVVKNLPANAGDTGSIPGLGRSPGGGHGNPLQHSCLENPLDRGAQGATVDRVAQSQTQLSDLPCTHTGNNMCFPGGSAVKNLPALQEARVPSLSGRCPGEERDNPLQSSCLKNPMDRRA